MRSLKNQEGTIFLTTMVVLLLMILTGSFFFAMSSGAFSYSKALERSAQSKYLADGALSRLFSTVTATQPTGTTFSNQSLGPGAHSGSITNIGGRFLATGSGNVINSTKTSTAEITPPTLNALNFAIAGGGNVQWTSTGGGSSNAVTGDIYTGGTATLNGTVAGNVSAAGSTITTTGTISGTQTTNYAPVVSFPTVDTSFYQSIANANGYYYNGDRSYSSGTFPAAPTGGVVYVNGNLTLYGVVTTTACIIATGDINMVKVGGTQPSVTINQYSNYPALMTINGSITQTCDGNSGDFDVDGLVYSGNNFTLTQNHDDVTINGSVLARGSVTTSFTSQSTVNTTYVAQNPPGFSSGSATTQIVSYNT